MNDTKEFEQAMDVIQQEINYIFKHEVSFLREFGQERPALGHEGMGELTSISFAEAYVHFVYVTDVGQSFFDAIPVDVYLTWKIDNE